VSGTRSRHTTGRIVFLLILALILVACDGGKSPAIELSGVVKESTPVATTGEAETAAVDPYLTIYGDRLPEDAAPYELQIYKEACDISGNHITFDFQVSVYQPFCLANLFQDQLVSLDKDFKVTPASAERWEVSEDGLTWTFHIKPGLQWSDGTPLTAHDWEATYQLIANPDHGWDFAWFYTGVLKNWDEIIAGELPPGELGVKAVDDLTLQIITQRPWPPLPAMMQFSYVLQKKALQKHGPLYNSNVATSVSAGPFMLDVLEPGQRIELVANPHYRGYRPPRLQRLIAEYRSPDTFFLAFQNGEVDRVQSNWLSPADYSIIQSDPTLSANYLRHFGDFRTDYLLFDTYNPPFNDMNVRKALAHAVDREAIVSNVFGEIKAMPAYSFLMPGFPASDTEDKLMQYQSYDCDRAKDYLAQAGYPDGQGFPKLEMWLRNEPPAMQAVYQAVAASIQQCLNITIEVSNKDFKAYMDALNAKPTGLKFGAVSYGMDYLDPANMLGIWVSTGRHAWKNEEFERLVNEAAGITDDPVRRKALFQEAERILVENVGGIFLAHRWQGDILQPYLRGDSIRSPDSQGIAGWHWGNDWVWGNIYISKDVVNRNTYRTK